TADVAIVLGGAIGQPFPPRVYVDLAGSADRVWHAARLYRQKKVPRIVISAGNIVGGDSVESEASLIAGLLGEWGVPSEAITIEGTSRNTYENAAATKELFGTEGWTSALLVTSAAHMPRAIAVFRKAGLNVTPSPTDVRVVGPLSGTVYDFLPQVGALALTTGAIKEWIGFIVYRMAGWA
ncbi:MAG: YdcF family protein, partial [bacterium]|nr:YdcF family protein [bacterium]